MLLRICNGLIETEFMEQNISDVLLSLKAKHFRFISFGENLKERIH